MVSKREVRITAAEYAEAIGPLITRVLEPVRQVLEDLAIVPDDIDSVLMTGGTPQHGLDDELTRLLAHTVRPFADGSSHVRHLSAAETADARPAPIDTSVRVVEADPAVTVNGEPQGVVTRGL